MTLLTSLVDTVESDLAGFTGRTETMATLASSVGASGSASVSIDEADAMIRGPIQVDDELMMVTSFDGKTGTVPAWGRGYGGSAAGTHSAGARVTIKPVFPRYKISEAIEETVRSLWPDVYGVGKVAFTVSTAVHTYALPAAVFDVLDVQYDAVGPTQTWPQVKSWRFDGTANLTDFPTGRSVTIPAHKLQSGRTVDVLVKTRPEITSSTTSWNEIFLEDSVAEAVKLGAKYRLVSQVDFANLDATSYSVGMAQRPEGRTNPSDLSRQLFALYMQAVERERDRLNATLTPTMHWVG